MENQRPLPPELLACAEALLACERACRDVAASPSSEATGPVAEARRWMTDCAELCRAGASLVRSRSPLHVGLLALCAEACDACADACERAGERAGGPLVAECGRICRATAGICARVTASRRAA